MRQAPIPDRHGFLQLQPDLGPTIPVQQNWTVPSKQRWLIHALQFTITTDAATPGNRRTVITITATNTILKLYAQATQAAGQTRSYNYAPNLRDAATFLANQLQQALPSDLYLPPGATIEINATPAIVNDSLDTARLYTEAWIDG